MNEVKAFAYSASIVMSLSYNNDTKIVSITFLSLELYGM